MSNGSDAGVDVVAKGSIRFWLKAERLLEKGDITSMELARNTKGNIFSNKSSFKVWSIDNCAEIYSVNNALK